MTKTHDAHYLFDSASTPGQVWTVQYVETATGWELQCDCPAARYYRKCWHLKAAREAESGKPAAEQPAIRPEFERAVTAYLDSPEGAARLVSIIDDDTPPTPKRDAASDPRFAWMYRQ